MSYHKVCGVCRDCPMVYGPWPYIWHHRFSFYLYCGLGDKRRRESYFQISGYGTVMMMMVMMKGAELHRQRETEGKRGRKGEREREGERERGRERVVVSQPAKRSTASTEPVYPLLAKVIYMYLCIRL